MSSETKYKELQSEVEKAYKEWYSTNRARLDAEPRHYKDENYDHDELQPPSAFEAGAKYILIKTQEWCEREHPFGYGKYEYADRLREEIEQYFKPIEKDIER